VVAQDPAAGTSVSEGTFVNYRVELAEPQGIKSIVLANQHQQGRAVEVFLWDSATGAWSSKGMLSFNASITLPLATGRTYTVVAVDRGLVNCTDGRPDNVSCQRFRVGALGNSGGTEARFKIS
jgi:hypothetical protein